MSDRKALFTIGEISRRAKLPVRTVRFWSDEGLVPPTDRSSTGYRLYDAEAVARLDLVQTLRDFDLDLPTIRSVLDRQSTVADVADAHARAIDVKIRLLKVRRTVLRSVAQRGSTTEEMKLMHKLARLSAEERQRMIDGFVDAVFEGVDGDTPGAEIAKGMRMMPPDLPDDPSTEQVDAWVELAELVGDEDFRLRCRQMAVAGANGPQPGDVELDHAKVAELAGKAVADGVAPGSAEGAEILHRIVDADMSAEEREKLADQIATFSDRRVERYWQLLAILNGWPQRPAMVPTFEWFLAALRESS
ncbi:MAG: MerR family transcriptional regulator [Stackebrandtia sp.]